MFYSLTGSQLEDQEGGGDGMGELIFGAFGWRDDDGRRWWVLGVGVTD